MPDYERLISLDEVEEITNTDYVMIDSATGGVRKFKASSLGGGGSSTLIEKSITANGTYDAEDDEADGYSSVTVNVPSVDGVYFDGTTTNVLKIPYSSRDYEYKIKFYIASQQTSRMIFGTTTNGWYPVLFMNSTTGWTLSSGDTSVGQIQYVPESFAGEHTVILNRLEDRAIIFDDENLGTYGTSYFSTDNYINIGNTLGIYAAEFILEEFKLTDHSTGVVVADYVPGFVATLSKIRKPCLYNTVDNTYIDLNTGRYEGNNNGHVTLGKLPRPLDPNYNYYTYGTNENIVVRVYHEGESDEEIRWYFHDFYTNNDKGSGRQAFPTALAQYYTTGSNAQSAKLYQVGTSTVQGWCVLSDYLDGTINAYSTNYQTMITGHFDAMIIIGNGTEQDTTYSDPYVYL